MQAPASSRAPWRRALATLFAAGLLVAACGGSDDNDDDGAADGGSGTTSGEVGGDITAPPDDTAEPVRGGTLTYAVEADTLNGWLPSAMLCAAACHSTVGRTIFEPLTVVADDGEVYPYLLESVEPNEDATVWTLTTREGINFHDGTLLDAEAIVLNLEKNRTGSLLVDALAPIDTITATDARTVTITTLEPWPAFAIALSGQFGYMGSPTWINAVEGDPSLASQPVGTGPFSFTGYEPGGFLTAERFEGYWRGDEGLPTSLTGEGLPYLDGIEVRFIESSDDRSSAVSSGDLDLIQTANGVEIAALSEEDGLVSDVLDNEYEIETAYLLINNLPEVDGQPNPFANEEVRRALALATDNSVLQSARTADLFPVANGPYPPGVDGYLDDTGFPQFDLAAATALVEEIEAESGPITIRYKTTNDPFNSDTATLLQQMWEAAGFDVEIDTTAQGDFIGQAIAGNFQVFGWRNHAGIDPDQQYVWWHSSISGLPTSRGLALNFGRIRDDEVDRLLGVIRSSTDDDERRTAAEDLNRYMGEHVFNVWNNWVYWSLVHAENVHGVVGISIPGPDGVPLEGVRGINMGANLPGIIIPTETFITE